MRKTAPEMPGSAASQNSSSVVKRKPTEGNLATTTDHTCQTANDSNKAGMETQRVRRAIALPVVSQNLLSSGRQSVSTAPGRQRHAPSAEWTDASTPGRRLPGGTAT